MKEALNFRTSFKDGDDDDTIGDITEVTINFAENGYILIVSGDDSVTEVYPDNESLLKRLKELV